VQQAANALTGESTDVIEALTIRMNAHSEAQRYEEAAYLRDRIQTFETVLRRQKQAEKLCNQGKFTVSFDNIVYEVDNGVLASTRNADQLFMPLASLSKQVHEAIVVPNGVHDEHGMLRSDAMDEVLCIAKFLEAQQ
jgi:excinuclease UvrABC nuclease subunit